MFSEKFPVSVQAWSYRGALGHTLHLRSTLSYECGLYPFLHQSLIVLSWSKSSFEAFHILWKNPNELFSQPNTNTQVLQVTLLVSHGLVSQLISSVTQSCPTLCDPMNPSMPGFLVHHKLPEFIQTHAHRVGDAIQPSHPLSFPSPPALNPSQHQGLFQWVNSLHEVAKILEFQLQHHSF